MDLPSGHMTWSDRFLNLFRSGGVRDNPVLKILIGLLLAGFVTVLFPHPESIEYNYSLGAIWAEKDLISPYSFPIFKDLHEYEKELQDAARSVPPVFERREESAAAGTDSVAAIIGALQRAPEVRSRWMRTRNPDDSLEFARVLGRIPIVLTDGEWRLLNEWRTAERRGDEPFPHLERLLTKYFSEAARVGIIDQIKVRRSQNTLAIRKGSTEELIPYDKVFDLDEASAAIDSQIVRSIDDNDARLMASRIARVALRPNLVLDQSETGRAIQSAQDNVPRTIGYVQENERIIGRHERVTEETKLKLDSFQKAKVERGAEYNEWRHWFGITFHACLILVLYAVYLFLFRKRIFHDNTKLTLIALLIAMETFFAYVTSAMNLSEPVEYLIFVPAASMLLTIIFDSRVAFYGTVTMALLIGGIKGNDYAIALASLVPGSLAAYTVRDIRNRTQIFRSLVFIYFGYAVSIIALSLERYESVNVIAMSLTYALANAVFSPVLTYGLLIFFERVFNVTTDLTLLELSDFNQPLLRQLSEKAPGTFHHSMLLGNLAEAAAEAIGANSILARVGAYYHDIGKMLKPEYFVENQVGGHNRHVRLKPRMSALIIAAHVKEGIELGRQYGLPRQVLDFIPQHHGTTLMSFFYDKAVRQASRKPLKDKLAEEDFRYPGPKPQSKETGIVMLADSVEASTRALNDMTPQTLESAIENMTKQRFLDGQFDECELTLRDLTKIKEAFFKILIGIHHHRLQYPDQPGAEPRPEPPAPAEDASFVPPVPDPGSPAAEPGDGSPAPDSGDRPETGIVSEQSPSGT